MSDLRAVEIALDGLGAWSLPIWCAWCDAEYAPADLGGSGLVLWIDIPNMRVCSEGCAIEVRSAIAGGRTDIYTGRTPAPPWCQASLALADYDTKADRAGSPQGGQ